MQVRFVWFGLLLCALSLVSAPALKARDANLVRGWAQFAENDLDAAKASFEKALEGPDAAEAHLGLSLIGVSRSGSEMSFYHYDQYYRKAESPEQHLQALWQNMSPQKTEAQLEFLESVRTTAQSSRLRALAAQWIGRHYVATNDLKEADEYFAMIGTVDTWQILGEFENISESGFDKDVGAVDHPEASHRFRNKRGVEIQWFDLKQPRRDKWVDFEYHFYSDNSVMYAQTFCQSPDEREVQFRLGVSGSIKVWVNDQLQFSEAQERDNRLDSYVFRTKLMKGHNRILIQVGSSETDGSNFMLRITDLEGQLYDDLSYSREVRLYPKDYQYEAERFSDAVADHFVALIEEEPDWLSHYVALNQYFLSMDEVYLAKKYLKEAKKRFPDCTYITFQLLMASGRDNNETELSTYLEEIKSKDPDNLLALSVRFDEAVEIDDYEEAEAILGKIEAIIPNSEEVYEKQIELAGEREQFEELMGLSQAAFRRYPENAQFVRINYLIEKNARKDLKAARKLLEKYLKDHRNEDLTLELVSLYLNNGDVSKGLRLFDQLVEENPLATGYYSKLSGIYFSLGRYEQAEKMVQECIKIAPYVGSYHKSLGESYREMKRGAKAIEAFEQAVYYNPYDYEAREQLRILQGRGGVFDAFADPDAEEIYAQAPDGSEFPDDHSMILLDEVQRVVYEGGGSEFRQILVAKVFNSDGVDAWKEYRVSVNANQRGTIERAEVLKANGSKLEAQNQRGYLVFPNLEPGDAIHLRYRVQDYYFGKLVGHFWDQHYFSLYLPIQTSRYRLLVPAGKAFQHKVAHSDMEPKKILFGGQEIYTWERKDVPAIKYEPYMSELVDVEPVLSLSSLESWDYIADWYAGLAQAKAKTDFVVQETVAELFAGKEDLSEREIVRTIYDYVVGQIRYRSVPFLQSGLVPQKASQVISSKQGDCKDVSTLFVAMAKLKGIDAHLVLVNTRDNGRGEMPFPSISFNHCIVKVNVEEEDYFVELTADNYPFSSGGASVKKAFALEISPQTQRNVQAKLLTPETMVPNQVIREGTVSLTESKLTVVRSCIKTGTLAASMRDSYENIGRQRQLEDMQEAINDEYPNVRLLDVGFHDDLFTNGDSVTYTYSYEAPDVLMQIGGLDIFKLPFADDLASTSMDFLSTETRKYPIELWRYFRAEYAEETLRVKLPEGRQFAEIPESLTYDHANAHYELRFTFDEATQELVVTRRFVLRDDIVQPEAYPAFKAFMGKVMKADKMRLALR